MKVQSTKSQSRQKSIVLYLDHEPHYVNCLRGNFYNFPTFRKDFKMNGPNIKIVRFYLKVNINYN